MVAGIILFALGVKTTLAHHNEPLEIIPAIGLCGGLALYMAAHVAVRLRMNGSWGHGRPTATVVLVALIPIATLIPSLAALALVAAVCAALIAYEALRYAYGRAWIRSRRGAFTMEEASHVAPRRARRSRTLPHRTSQPDRLCARGQQGAGPRLSASRPGARRAPSAFGPESLRHAAWAGLQDSVPRSGPARAACPRRGRGARCRSTTLRSSRCGDRAMPRMSCRRGSMRPSRSVACPGRAECRRERRIWRPARMPHLAGRRLPVDDVAGVLGSGNGIRYATLTGTVLIRWAGARQPTIWTVPRPELTAAEALQGADPPLPPRLRAIHGRCIRALGRPRRGRRPVRGIRRPGFNGC